MDIAWHGLKTRVTIAPPHFTDKSCIAAILSSSALAKASPRKRLWLGAGAVALFVATVYALYATMPARPERPALVPGLDFVSFYTAGTAVREGRARELYDLEATKKFQASLQDRDGLAVGNLYAPWWNPPFYALAFVPLSTLTFFHALSVWLAINVVCTAVAVWLLCRMLPAGTDWRTWALVPVLVALSMPFMATLTHGQNSGTSLLLVTLTVHFWRKGRGLPSGLVCGLLFYKPQLALALAGVMVVDLGAVAGMGVAATGIFLLTINLVLLPGTLSAFLHQVPANLHFVQEQSIYPWARHVTPKAMFRVLIQGRGIGETSAVVTGLSYLTTAVVTGLLGRLAIKSRGWRALRDRLIAATIVATPVIMPFYFDYDLLLMAVPAVLVVVETIGCGKEVEAAGDLAFPHGTPCGLVPPSSTGWKPVSRKCGIAGLLSVLYGVLLFNPDLTEALRINFAAVVLMALSAVVIFRTNPSEIAAQPAELRRLAA